jgi:hypothetical protein
MTVRKTLRGAAVALAVGLTFLAAGCSGSGDDSTDAGGAASSAQAADAPQAAEADSAVGVAGDESAKAPERSVDVAALVDAQQIRTGQVTLRVEAIDESSAKVRGIAAGLGGLVQDENSTFGSEPAQRPKKKDRGSSVITLRVPAQQLDAAIDQLGDVGTRLNLRTTTQDVTTSIADLDSRVNSQERSVERMRTLLAEADSVKDVIAIESELSTREADLESLQAQARAVKDKVALSTLVVTLELPGAAPAPKDDPNGFTEGLATGWDALKGTTVVVLTVLGVLIPLGVTVAVIGVPLWFAYRRFRPSTP